jgi:hypothetical protein
MVGQLYEGVRFVVLQADVVAGLVALDQVRLQQQRLSLRVRDRGVDSGGSLDHPADPLTARVRVRGNAVAQVHRLPDVEDGPVGVLELVDARAGGEVRRPLSDCGRVHAVPGSERDGHVGVGAGAGVVPSFRQENRVTAPPRAGV